MLEKMRSVWCLLLVGLATGSFGDKSPPVLVDDLYLEGKTSGDLPVDDEDGEDVGSGSGSGDYVFSDEEETFRRFVNFSKSREDPPGPGTLDPRPTADWNPNTAPTPLMSTEDPGKDWVPDVVPTADGFTHQTPPTSTSMSTSETSAGPDGRDESTTQDGGDQVLVREGADDLTDDGEGSRMFDVDAGGDVTSENLWERTEVLAAVVACAVVGVLCASLLLLFLAYRMKKKDEGSYDLGDTKLTTTAYRTAPTREFYA